MLTLIWPFFIGICVGGVTVWTRMWLTATVNPVHAPPRPNECWTVQSIAARIERERREARRNVHGAGQLHCR